MEIKKLNENRFDVVLHIEDLEKFNITLSQFMSMKIENFDFFRIILKYMDKFTDFSLKNRKIFFDTFFIDNSYFLIKFYIVGIVSGIGKFLPKVGKNISISNKVSMIFGFSSFDSLCDFLRDLNNIKKEKLLELLNYIEFFKYKNSYFVIIKDSIFSTNLLDFICLHITEFAEFISCSDIFAKKIQEFGCNVDVLKNIKK